MLALGAAGALLGTRFYATPEALGHPEVKRALLDAGEGQTERTSVFDAARDRDWPAGYTGRAVRNEFLARWRGRDDELRADTAEKRRYADASAAGDPATAVVWASEATELIDELRPAAELITTIGTAAEQAL